MKKRKLTIQPFGAPMAGRTYYASNGYNYGYQGSMKDDEISGGGNSYTTEFRQLDPRLGRWWSVDKITNASESPFVSMANNPIWFNDVFGTDIGKPGDAKQTAKDKKIVGDLKAGFKKRETELQTKLDEVKGKIEAIKTGGEELNKLNSEYRELNVAVHDIKDAQTELDALENDHTTFYTFKQVYNKDAHGNDENAELHNTLETDKKGNQIFTIPYTWGAGSTGSKAHEAKHAYQYLQAKIAGAYESPLLKRETEAYIRQFVADPGNPPRYKDPSTGQVKSINSYRDVNEEFLRTFKNKDGSPVYNLPK